MKTIIYNIGTLAGILPEGVDKLEGAQMNNVECIDNAYLTIEDGVITDFGPITDVVSGCSGFQNRATPLAAEGGAHEVGGIVSKISSLSIIRIYLQTMMFKIMSSVCCMPIEPMRPRF